MTGPDNPSLAPLEFVPDLAHPRECIALDGEFAKFLQDRHDFPRGGDRFGLVQATGAKCSRPVRGPPRGFSPEGRIK